MSVISWWKRIWSWKRNISEVDDDPTLGELREFVYLDEDSLVSLIASRNGPIAAEIRESSKSMLAAGASGGLAVGSSVVSKANMGFDVSTSSTTGVETTFKLVAQARFKDFYDNEEGILDLSLPEAVVVTEECVPSLERANSLPIARLERGRLVEFELIPRAERMFSVATVFGEIASAIDDAALTSSQKGQFGGGFDYDALFGMQLLKKLQLGLVPIEGHIPGVAVITVDGVDHVIQTPARDSNLHGLDFNIRPLRIVTMAQSSNFWKDFRRVLYSGQPYRVLARVSGPELIEDWNTMPLVDVMKTLEGNAFEPLYRALDELRVSDINTATALTQGGVDRLRGMYGQYALSLVGDSEENSDEFADLREFVRGLEIAGATVSEQQAAFEKVTRFVRDKYPLVEVRDGKGLLALRSAARENFRVGIDGEGVLASSQPVSIRQGEPEVATIEVDMVAMYW